MKNYKYEELTEEQKVKIRPEINLLIIRIFLSGLNCFGLSCLSFFILTFLFNNNALLLFLMYLLSALFLIDNFDKDLDYIFSAYRKKIDELLKDSK
jgi:hypothetical protein